MDAFHKIPQTAATSCPPSQGVDRARWRSSGLSAVPPANGAAACLRSGGALFWCILVTASGCSPPAEPAGVGDRRSDVMSSLEQLYVSSALFGGVSSGPLPRSSRALF